MTDRVDIIVFGATSLTGAYVTEYLANHPDQPSFAIAGRSRKKLDALRSKFSLPSSVPTVIADSFDEQAIKQMVARGRAVLNLAGPFNTFNAQGIIEECIRQKVHYTDLTGESGYYKKVVDACHEPARRAGVVVLPSAGFDVLPFDLSTYLAIQQLKSQAPAAKVTNIWCSFHGVAGLSKGTLMSAVDMASEPGVKWQMKSVRPDAFSPIDGKHKIPWTPMKAPGFGGYMAFTPFSPHNHRVVNRTYGLLQTEAKSDKDKYGTLFQFHDGAAAGRYWLGAMITSLITKFISLMLIYFPPARWPIRAPPDGWKLDTAYIRKNAHVDMRTVADSQAGERAICRLRIQGDAGYAKTAVMISECTLTILKDHEQMHPIAKAGGVVTTPLLGAALVQRLKREGSFLIETETFSADGKKRQ